ncbi:uncharacterized protein LOC143300332 [Babylonia areolata]|uniref:uncharacterized protein LOC143300332 n=1 Tax=Babylonia areolata TaxID=304850 RepID=UPI003FD4ADE0
MITDSWLATDGSQLTNTTTAATEVDYGNMSTTQVTEQTFAQYGDTSPRQSPQQQSFLHYEIGETLWRVVPPFILALGTFGNVMTVLVMRAMRGDGGGGGGGGGGGPSADPSMFVYFPCLAVCDQIVLTVGLSRLWAKSALLYDVRTVHAAVCKLHKFAVFSAGRMATWILVAVTSQRVMTVMWPLRQRLSSTARRAKGTVAVIVGVCLVLDSGILAQYTLLKNRKGQTKCWAVKDDPAAALYEDEVYPWLNIVTGSLLPLSLLVLNNVVLGVKVTQALRASRHMTDAEQSATRSRQASSLSLTLIVTSLTFVMLTSSIPAGFFVKRFYLPSVSSDGQLEADLDLSNAVLDLLWYCNSAVNFYLYFLTGPTFRRQATCLLSSLPLPCRPRGQPSSAAIRNDSASSSASAKDPVRH